jgi:putative DNA methylase
LIGKALVEIPAKFAGQPPVNPRRDLHKHFKGAQGLAEDVRYYGRWIRDEAEGCIGHLYPKAKLPDGSKAIVVAWLWSRTVRSPDPAAKGAHVPLVSSFMLSTKEGSKSWVKPVIDTSAPDGWRFEAKTGMLTKSEEEELAKGTRGQGRGSNFVCVLTGTTIGGSYIKSEGMAGRVGQRLMAIVTEGTRARVYISPNAAQETAARLADSDRRVADARENELAQPVPERLTGGTCFSYGLTSFDKLFTPRQLVALTTFSDLIRAAHERVLTDARAAGLADDRQPLHAGGAKALAYADAVATYLAFALSKLADRGSSICTWFTARDSTRPTFARQAIPMSWDFAELNTLLEGTGSFQGAVMWTAESVEALDGHGEISKIFNIDASKNSFPIRPAIISTDPPVLRQYWLRRPFRLLLCLVA